MFSLVVVRTAVRAAYVAVLTVAALALALPAAAQDGSASARSLSISVGANGVDVAAFRQLIAARYHVRVERIVASDIDRDGDVDIVAASRRSVIVLLNDGVGHLEEQRPRQVPSVAGQPADGTWNHRDDRRDESLQDGSPSAWVFGARPHTPPASHPGSALVVLRAPHSILPTSPAAPRAPPA